MERTNKEGVLLVTIERSEHASSLEDCLESLGVRYSRLNTDSAVKNLPQYSIDNNGPRITFIDTQGYEQKASEFSTVWWDEVVPCPESFKNLQYSRWAYLETQKASTWILESLGVKYVNSPNAIIFGSNKVLQLQAAFSLGFVIPSTLISSDPKIVEGMTKDPSIYKPISRPTMETVGSDKIIFTSVIDRNTVRPDSISCKLSLFQRYVPKKYEVRSYVIGDECLSARIHSQDSKRAKIDWRKYDIANTPHYIHDLPLEVADRCIQLTKMFNLDYSAIDLIVTPEDDYVFLEMNPQGLWLWIEKLTNLPITQRLALYLSKNSRKN